MKAIHLILPFLLISNFVFSQDISQKDISKKTLIDFEKVKEDFNELLFNIKNHYPYLNEGNISLQCVKDYYSEQIKDLKTLEDVVLFFEFILMEFHDNHFTLNINNKRSYRIFAPIFLKYKNESFFIENVWSSQIKNLDVNILNAEILSFNGVEFSKEIEDFPIQCANKNNQKIKEWIANKIIFGTYNAPRVLKLKLKNNSIYTLDLDKIVLKKSKSLLSAEVVDNTGIISIHNSLGNNNLIKEFDNVLDSLSETKAIILDLRNTLNGGNTYVAKGIMSRFINKEKAYQKHSLIESYDNCTKIKRTFIEYVSPRGKHYSKPLIVLVGRWTGSMGEGLAIGLDGLNRAKIVGTEMRKLLGAVYTIPLKNFSFAYNMPTEKLFHINNTARENFTPKHYINQINLDNDIFINKALKLLFKN